MRPLPTRQQDPNTGVNHCLGLHGAALAYFLSPEQKHSQTQELQWSEESCSIGHHLWTGRTRSLLQVVLGVCGSQLLRTSFDGLHNPVQPFPSSMELPWAWVFLRVPMTCLKKFSPSCSSFRITRAFIQCISVPEHSSHHRGWPPRLFMKSWQLFH